MDFDVIYIGSGHACWHGALILLRAGKKVAFAEHDVVGGTCTNYGCDAKIVLDGPFEYLSGLARYQGLCVDGQTELDWGRLMSYKEQQIAPLSVGMEQGFTRAGLTFLKGETFLKDAHTVTVDGKDYDAARDEGAEASRRIESSILIFQKQNRNKTKTIPLYAWHTSQAYRGYFL